MDTFDKVQQIRQQRQRKTKSGCTSNFSGLVYCADCGEKLYYGATNNGKREGAFFDCSLHWKRKDKCGTHFIRESVLERLVLRHIQLVTDYILHHRQHFISAMERSLQLESAERLEASRKQLEAEVIALQQEIEVQERQNENIEKFIRKADKHVGIEEIDPAMLRELIQSIYVEAPDKSSGKRKHISTSSTMVSALFLWMN